MPFSLVVRLPVPGHPAYEAVQDGLEQIVEDLSLCSSDESRPDEGFIDRGGKTQAS